MANALFNKGILFCFFAFRDTNRDILVFLRPEKRDMATREFKVRSLIQ